MLVNKSELIINMLSWDYLIPDNALWPEGK